MQPLGRQVRYKNVTSLPPRLAAFSLLILASATGWAADADQLVKEALAAEAKMDSTQALKLFLEADKAKPNDSVIVQKIARQYSDLVVDQKTTEEKKKYAQTALEYAKKSVELDPKNAVNVLSLAVCHGTLGVYSDTRTKVEYSRLVKEEAERALALDANYAWSYHVLGRWNYEVATLGSTARIFVKLFYGGLPAASTAQAIKHLEHAVELEPGEPEHVLELGFAYRADGQNDKARACFEKGLAMPIREKHGEAAKQRAKEALAKLG
jgi:tetratricopeptide (TPR) repeat protein